MQDWVLVTNEKGILFLTEFSGVLMNRQNGQRTLRMQNFRETRELHLSHTTHWRASKERVICLGGAFDGKVYQGSVCTCTNENIRVSL